MSEEDAIESLGSHIRLVLLLFLLSRQSLHGGNLGLYYVDSSVRLKCHTGFVSIII